MATPGWTWVPFPRWPESLSMLKRERGTCRGSSHNTTTEPALYLPVVVFMSIIGAHPRRGRVTPDLAFSSERWGRLGLKSQHRGRDEAVTRARPMVSLPSDHLWFFSAGLRWLKSLYESFTCLHESMCRALRWSSSWLLIEWMPSWAKHVSWTLLRSSTEPLKNGFSKPGYPCTSALLAQPLPHIETTELAHSHV